VKVTEIYGLSLTVTSLGSTTVPAEVVSLACAVTKVGAVMTASGIVDPPGVARQGG